MIVGLQEGDRGGEAGRVRRENADVNTLARMLGLEVRLEASMVRLYRCHTEDGVRVGRRGTLEG